MHFAPQNIQLYCCILYYNNKVVKAIKNNNEKGQGKTALVGKLYIKSRWHAEIKIKLLL